MKSPITLANIHVIEEKERLSKIHHRQLQLSFCWFKINYKNDEIINVILKQ